MLTSSAQQGLCGQVELQEDDRRRKRRSSDDDNSDSNGPNFDTSSFGENSGSDLGPAANFRQGVARNTNFGTLIRPQGFAGSASNNFGIQNPNILNTMMNSNFLRNLPNGRARGLNKNVFPQSGASESAVFRQPMMDKLDNLAELNSMGIQSPTQVPGSGISDANIENGGLTEVKTHSDSDSDSNQASNAGDTHTEGTATLESSNSDDSSSQTSSPSESPSDLLITSVLKSAENAGKSEPSTHEENSDSSISELLKDHSDSSPADVLKDNMESSLDQLKGKLDSALDLIQEKSEPSIDVLKDMIKENDDTIMAEPVSEAPKSQFTPFNLPDMLDLGSDKVETKTADDVAGSPSFDDSTLLESIQDTLNPLITSDDAGTEIKTPQLADILNTDNKLFGSDDRTETDSTNADIIEDASEREPVLPGIELSDDKQETNSATSTGKDETELIPLNMSPVNPTFAPIEEDDTKDEDENSKLIASETKLSDTMETLMENNNQDADVMESLLQPDNDGLDKELPSVDGISLPDDQEKADTLDGLGSVDSDNTESSDDTTEDVDDAIVDQFPSEVETKDMLENQQEQLEKNNEINTAVLDSISDDAEENDIVNTIYPELNDNDNFERDTENEKVNDRMPDNESDRNDVLFEDKTDTKDNHYDNESETDADRFGDGIVQEPEDTDTDSFLSFDDALSPSNEQDNDDLTPAEWTETNDNGNIEVENNDDLNENSPTNDSNVELSDDNEMFSPAGDTVREVESDIEDEHENETSTIRGNNTEEDENDTRENETRKHDFFDDQLELHEDIELSTQKTALLPEVDEPTVELTSCEARLPSVCVSQQIEVVDQGTLLVSFLFCLNTYSIFFIDFLATH